MLFVSYIIKTEKRTENGIPTTILFKRVNTNNFGSNMLNCSKNLEYIFKKIILV